MGKNKNNNNNVSTHNTTNIVEADETTKVESEVATDVDASPVTDANTVTTESETSETPAKDIDLINIAKTEEVVPQEESQSEELTNNAENKQSSSEGSQTETSESFSGMPVQEPSVSDKPSTETITEESEIDLSKEIVICAKVPYLESEAESVDALIKKKGLKAVKTEIKKNNVFAFGSADSKDEAYKIRTNVQKRTGLSVFFLYK